MEKGKEKGVEEGKVLENIRERRGRSRIGKQKGKEEKERNWKIKEKKKSREKG